MFVETGDLDGDSDLDIVAGGWWWEQVTNNVWTRHDIGGDLKNMAAVYDLDGDGDLDILGTNGAHTGNEFHWAQNDGAGSFTIFDNIDAGGVNAGCGGPLNQKSCRQT